MPRFLNPPARLHPLFLCYCTVPTRIHGQIKHRVFPPRPLLKHRAQITIFYIFFYIRTLHLVRKQNPVRACCHHHIFCSHHYNRDFQFINHMCIFTILGHYYIPDRLLLHHLRQGIPCPKVFPFPMVGKDCHGFRLFHHGIVKACLFKLPILAQHVRIAGAGDNLFHNPHQVR